MKRLFIPGDILLPEKIDMSLWSVIACDQYTSQPEYWDAVDKKVGETPSTLRLIMPEAYLESLDTATETKRINKTMESYIEEGILKTVEDSFIYVERELTVGETRRGIIGLLDLEEYDYGAESRSPIHATEGTVESRLPARVKVREGACLELPHIIVFIDDPDNRVLGNVDCCESLYDFNLMDGGGHIVGKRVSKAGAEKVMAELDKLSQPDYLENRYELSGRAAVIIAMGDGNHSLATAKFCWEQIKQMLSSAQQTNHPARFGLAELVNIHDPSVVFEPIHRVIFDSDVSAFSEEARAYFKFKSGEGHGKHIIMAICNGNKEELLITGHTIGESIAIAQNFCNEYIEKHGGRLDYIHDDETAINMSSEDSCAGLLLPAMDKNELFPSIIKSGVFPAKSFSIGPARDKRYYLECREII